MTIEDKCVPRLSGAARRTRWLAIALGVSGLMGLVVGLLTGLSEVMGADRGPSPLSWLIGALLAVGLLVGGWASFKWWRAIDELARQVHERAWFWGGSFGLVSGLLALSFSQTLPPPAAAFLERSDPGTLLQLGGAVVSIGAVAGYGLAWGVFWLRHR